MPEEGSETRPRSKSRKSGSERRKKAAMLPLRLTDELYARMKERADQEMRPVTEWARIWLAYATTQPLPRFSKKTPLRGIEISASISSSRAGRAA